MTYHLDQAIDAADDISRKLSAVEGHREAGDDQTIDEDEIEKLAGQVVSGVKMHNDELAEDSWE